MEQFSTGSILGISYLGYLANICLLGKLYSPVSWPDRNSELRDLFAKEKEYVNVLEKIVNVRHWIFLFMTNPILTVLQL